MKWESWQREGLGNACWHNKKMKLYLSLSLFILNWMLFFLKTSLKSECSCYFQKIQKAPVSSKYICWDIEYHF